MSYHKVKMDEINDSIKTLWNTTYQGTGERFPLLLLLLARSHSDLQGR
jgi:hypothetical protein